MKWIVYVCACDQQMALPAYDDHDSSEINCPNCGICGSITPTSETFEADLPEPTWSEPI